MSHKKLQYFVSARSHMKPIGSIKKFDERLAVECVRQTQTPLYYYNNRMITFKRMRIQPRRLRPVLYGGVPDLHRFWISTVPLLLV
jgi:hypothetical protein